MKRDEEVGGGVDKEDKEMKSFYDELKCVESDVERDVLCLERRYSDGFERASKTSFEFDFVATDEIAALKNSSKIRIRISLGKGFPKQVPSIDVANGPKDAAKNIETVLRLKAASYSKKLETSYLRKLLKWLDKNMLRIFNDENSKEKKTEEISSFMKQWEKSEHDAFERAIRKYLVPKLRSRRKGNYSQSERQSWWYKIAETINTKRTPEECVFHYRKLRLKMLESRLRHDKSLRKSVERAREALELIRSVLVRKFSTPSSSSLSTKENEITKEEKEEEREETTKYDEKKLIANEHNKDTTSPVLLASAPEFLPTHPLTTKHTGIQIILSNVEMKCVSLVQCVRLGVQVRCKRCRKDNSISLTEGTNVNMSCSQCRQLVTLGFRGNAVHSNSSTLGYIDLIENCSAVHSMYLSDFHVTCANCGTLEKIRDVRPIGDPAMRFCKSCHAKMEFNSRHVKFARTISSSSSDSNNNSTTINVVKEGRSKRSMRAMNAALGIRVGHPLPQNGACKHYRRSSRWFRFPCCGKPFPCDKCHEAAENKCPLDARANREICGYCSSEQPISGVKTSKCRRCDKVISGAPKTRHWEGGQGCRDTSKMSRKDRAKYRNSKNKTTSNNNSGSSNRKKNK